MIQYFRKSNNQIVTIDAPEKDCWINIFPPFNQENLKALSENLNIPYDYLIDSIDINERSRFEQEDNVKLIVINTPIQNSAESGIAEDVQFIAIPIGIILTGEMIVTISAAKNPVIDYYVNKVIKKLEPHEREKFVLHILERNADYFLHYLQQINKRRNEFEQELYNSSRNEELSKLLNLQKGLVYFSTNLRTNELVLMKMHRTNFLGLANDEDAEELFEDILIDNKQALEMTDVYTNILNGTMDAFASIISNNLNKVLKRLTSITIVLMVPTLVASFYGMNTKLPFTSTSTDVSFWLILAASVVFSLLIVLLFRKKDFF